MRRFILIPILLLTAACAHIPRGTAFTSAYKPGFDAADAIWRTAGWPLPDRCASYGIVTEVPGPYLSEAICPSGKQHVIGCRMPLGPFGHGSVILIAGDWPEANRQCTAAHERLHHLLHCALGQRDIDHTSPSVWGLDGFEGQACAQFGVRP